MNPIWKVPWFRPSVIPDFGAQVHVDALIFKLEHDGIYFPVSEWEKHQYRYRCMDCYSACGSDGQVFVTRYEKAAYLKEGPTIQQRDEMLDHAKQHTIMYRWAKGVI